MQLTLEGLLEGRTLTPINQYALQLPYVNPATGFSYKMILLETAISSVSNWMGSIFLSLNRILPKLSFSSFVFLNHSFNSHLQLFIYQTMLLLHLLTLHATLVSSLIKNISFAQHNLFCFQRPFHFIVISYHLHLNHQCTFYKVFL